MSWNIGSAHTHAADLLAILSEHRPHLLMIQEARLTKGTLAGLRKEARELGYAAFPSHNGDLGVFVMHGVNFLPLAAVEGDEQFKIARYGIQLAESRLLVRHSHGDPHSTFKRKALLSHLTTEDAGHLTVDNGDFNQQMAPAKSTSEHDSDEQRQCAKPKARQRQNTRRACQTSGSGDQPALTTTGQPAQLNRFKRAHLTRRSSRTVHYEELGAANSSSASLSEQ